MIFAKTCPPFYLATRLANVLFTAEYYSVYLVYLGSTKIYPTEADPPIKDQKYPLSSQPLQGVIFLSHKP